MVMDKVHMFQWSINDYYGRWPSEKQYWNMFLALGRFKRAIEPAQVAKQVEFYKNKEDIVFEEDEGSEPMDLSEDVVDAETKAQSNYSSS